uniref:Uncharacterized protein n=1 Tax=Peronospora matthiolae TaxID=2874970 RepID=A0AAV1SY56_9STRA
MRVQLADVASERDRAIQDHTTFRDRKATMVSGVNSATPTKVGLSTHTPVPANPQPMSNFSGSSRKGSCDSLPSSTMPTSKKVTRSAASKAKPSPVCDPNVARFAASKAKPSSVRDPKVARSATTKAKPSQVCDPKPSFSPKGTRDPKGHRDLKNRHEPAKPAATPKLGKQRRRGPS